MFLTEGINRTQGLFVEFILSLEGDVFIFDILIGLGLPWLVLIFMQKDGINVDTGEISHHILVLLGSVTGMLVLFLLTRWRVN